MLSSVSIVGAIMLSGRRTTGQMESATSWMSEKIVVEFSGDLMASIWATLDAHKVIDER